MSETEKMMPAALRRASSSSPPSSSITSQAFAWSWGIVALGVTLRLIRYLANRSLWLDESFLTESILTYSFRQLATEPLANWQAAPVAFLWLEKLAVTLFGTSEYALRLVPLIAGLASVPLFRAVAWRCLPPAGALVGLALFATVEPLIYYASEVKQYGVDVFVTLAVILVTLRVSEMPQRRSRVLALGLVGAAGLFLSHPAVFVLAAVVVVLGTFAVRGESKVRVGFVVLGSAWLILFALDYGLLLRPLTQHTGLVAYWAAGYMPHDWSAVPWLGQAVYGVFADYSTMWMPMADVSVLAAALGSAWFAMRDRRTLALLACPVLFALLAAGLHRFPFSGRLILFVVPLAILFIGAGVQAICDSLLPGRRIAGVILLLWIIAPEVGRALYFAAAPPAREEIRSILAHVCEHRQRSDVMYVLNLTQTPLRYYRDRFGVSGDRLGLSDMRCVIGRPIEATETAYAAEFEPFRGQPRLWILMTHFGGPPDEGVVIPAVLERMGGRRLDDFSARGARVLLYDLSTTPATTRPSSSASPGD